MKIYCVSGKARSGKDTATNIMKKILEKENKKVLIFHYADLLTMICTKYFGWDGKKDEKGRSLLQHTGTDIIRKKNKDFFVNFALQIFDIFNDVWDYVIIPDCRFENEIKMLKNQDLHITSLRVNRKELTTSGTTSFLSEKQLKHSSENSLDNYDFDFIINNDGTLEELKEKIIKIIKETM